MAFYIVTAKPKSELLPELKKQLDQDSISHLKPFGKALTYSLRNAKIQTDGLAVWEEEDYCTPPLKEEKEKVLNKYFEDIRVEKVNEGEGWKRINSLPGLYEFLIA